MDAQKDDRTSMSSESSHYKSAREDLTGLFTMAGFQVQQGRNY